MSHNIVALHGFLGRPNFWDNVVDELESDDDNSCWVPDLNLDPEFKERSWISWPDQFESWLVNNSVDGPIALVGYSMGGRLALEFARRRPNWISHLILISTRAALTTPQELKEREVWEKEWTKRFKNEDPSDWLKDWNDQPVFKGSGAQPLFNPKELSREAVVDTFTGWSVSSQDAQWEDLADIEAPTLWLMGENDEKYLALMKETEKAQPRAQFAKVSGAGHRIPLDQPSKLVQHMKKFLEGNSK